MMHFNTLTAVVAALAFTQGIVAAPVLQGTTDLHATLQPRSDTELVNPIDSATAQPHLHKRGFPHWADSLYLLIRDIFGGGDKHKKHHYSSSSSAYNCGGYSSCNNNNHYRGGYPDTSSYSYSRSNPGYQYRRGGSSSSSSSSSPDFEDGTRGSYSSSSSSSNEYDFEDGTRGGGAQIEYPYHRSST